MRKDQRERLLGNRRQRQAVKVCPDCGGDICQRCKSRFFVKSRTDDGIRPCKQCNPFIEKRTYCSFMDEAPYTLALPRFDINGDLADEWLKEWKADKKSYCENCYNTCPREFHGVALSSIDGGWFPICFQYPFKVLKRDGNHREILMLAGPWQGDTLSQVLTDFDEEHNLPMGEPMWMPEKEGVA